MPLYSQMLSRVTMDILIYISYIWIHLTVIYTFSGKFVLILVFALFALGKSAANGKT